MDKYQIALNNARLLLGEDYEACKTTAIEFGYLVYKERKHQLLSEQQVSDWILARMDSAGFQWYDHADAAKLTFFHFTKAAYAQAAEEDRLAA